MGAGAVVVIVWEDWMRTVAAAAALSEKGSLMSPNSGVPGGEVVFLLLVVLDSDMAIVSSSLLVMGVGSLGFLKI